MVSTVYCKLQCEKAHFTSEQFIDGVPHPELRDRMILKRSKSGLCRSSISSGLNFYSRSI